MTQRKIQTIEIPASLHLTLMQTEKLAMASDVLLELIGESKRIGESRPEVREAMDEFERCVRRLEVSITNLMLDL